MAAADEAEFAALIRRARRGDTGAVERLLQQNLSGLRAYVRLRSGGRVRAKESCSDLVQSVCREVLEDLAACRADREPAFRSWLYTMALRKIVDRRRYYDAEMRDAARETPIDGEAGGEEGRLLEAYGSLCTPSRQAAAREEVARIERAFDGLPEEYREVLTQARLVGLSHREIAARMGRSDEAVRMLLHRARARLARLLGPA